jgi:hypothetical protein
MISTRVFSEGKKNGKKVTNIYRYQNIKINFSSNFPIADMQIDLFEDVCSFFLQKETNGSHSNFVLRDISRWRREASLESVSGGA